MMTKKWLVIVCAVLLLVSYFLPWVVWDGSNVNGYELATGDFFKLSEAKLDLSNPFPNLAFTFYIFWLIPVLSVIIILLTIFNRKTGLLPFITGFSSISLITLYILFTDFGLGNLSFSLVCIAAWLHLFAAILLILLIPATSLLKKLVWILLGPVIVFASFKMIEKYIMAESHQHTSDVKADYTLGSAQLIQEFINNDTAANRKYLDKVLLINGPVSAIDIAADSTSTIRFADSTGSYAIFSLEKSELKEVASMKAGDMVSLKGVCSGSIFSDILGTTSISFKRGILNRNNLK